MNAYATGADLADWLGVATAPADADRLLERASEWLDAIVTARFDLDDDDLPEDPTVAVALNQAACAIVETWLALDPTGSVLAGADVAAYSIGDLSVTFNVPSPGVQTGVARVAFPARADRILRAAGLVGAPAAW